MTMKDAYSVMLKDYPDVLDINELSGILGISTKTAGKLIRTGQLKAMKIGRAYRIPKAYVLDYLKVLENGLAS